MNRTFTTIPQTFLAHPPRMEAGTGIKFFCFFFFKKRRFFPLEETKPKPVMEEQNA
jgi:hypothetical protein